jgi:hypothetical protein
VILLLLLFENSYIVICCICIKVQIFRNDFTLTLFNLRVRIDRLKKKSPITSYIVLHEDILKAFKFKQLIMSTGFYAIQNDKDIDTKVDNCSATYKRRKLQNSCFNSQFVDNSSQEIDKFWSFSLQLQCDLPAFIDRAKEVFRNNNKENIPDNISSTFLQYQKEFVNTAVGVYLQHFMPFRCPKLWTLAYNITSTAFSQDIDATNIDAQNADCYNRSFEDMAVVDNAMDKSLENDESLHNTDTSCQDFEFNDCHGTTHPNGNYLTSYSISPLRTHSH